LLKIFNFLFLSLLFSLPVRSQELFDLSDDSYNIAVLLPLTDKGQPTPDRRSFQVLEGIKYAVHLHNKNGGEKIGLFIRDTRGDEAFLNVIKDELMTLKNLKGIIGSTLSKDTKDLIKVFSDMGLPIVSPTATDELLSQLSPVVIQANPTFSTRGRLAAGFAKNFHGISSVGILYCSDGYSATLAESFKKEFENLGGKVTYYTSYTNASLRNEQLKTMIKGLEQAAEKFEGLYLPVSNLMQATFLSEQLKTFKYSKYVYGNQDWLLSDAFRDPAPFLEGLFVTTDYYVDFNDPVFLQKNKEFYSFSGYLFDRTAMYGFDATNMLIALLEKADFDPTAAVQAAETGFEFEGVKSKIVLDERRTNLSLSVLQNINNVFGLILKFKI